MTKRTKKEKTILDAKVGACICFMAGIVILLFAERTIHTTYLGAVLLGIAAGVLITLINLQDAEHDIKKEEEGKNGRLG